MTKKLFVCYRRNDSLDITLRIRDRLREEFGEANVFVDESSIGKGDDYRETINAALESADVVLVVIGKSWLGKSSASKTQDRLEETDDSVRIEIENAIANEKKILPVLVKDAEMPKKEQLPSSIEDLAYRHAERVGSGVDFFESDIRRLCQSLRRLLGLKKTILSSWFLALLIVELAMIIILVPLAIFLSDMNKPELQRVVANVEDIGSWSVGLRIESDFSGVDQPAGIKYWIRISEADDLSNCQIQEWDRDGDSDSANVEVQPIFAGRLDDGYDLYGAKFDVQVGIGTSSEEVNWSKAEEVTIRERQ